MTSFAFVTLWMWWHSHRTCNTNPSKSFISSLVILEIGTGRFPNVHKWIEAAKQRGVEDIFSKYEISLGVAERRIDHFESLMNILFNSLNLVVLKLKELHMPAKILSVNLPTLKTLHLKMVQFISKISLISKSFFLVVLFLRNRIPIPSIYI